MRNPHLAASTAKEFKETLAVELYLQHKNEAQVTKIMNEEYGIEISRPTVSNYIKAARETWKNIRLANAVELVEQELAELDYMEMRGMQTFLDFLDKMKDDPVACSREASEWYKNSLKTKEMRYKLLGLNAPVKMQHTGDFSINLTVADCGEDVQND